jgi:hypothetical protein
MDGDKTERKNCDKKHEDRKAWRKREKGFGTVKKYES